MVNTQKHPNKDEFLKIAKLVWVLKVALFGKPSLSATYAPTPKTKGKLWQLWNTTPGMIDAAAVIARDILSFYNNALFPEASSSHANQDTADRDLGTSQNNWEEDLECAMEGGNEEAFPFQFDPVVAPVTQPASVVLPPSASVVLPVHDPDIAATRLPCMSVTASMTSPAAPIIAVPSNSISLAMQDLALTDDSHAVEANVVGPIPPKPKPKPRHKAKADEPGAEVCRSGHKK
ncbi:hypothetical protein BDR04DRAFT_1118813 [Suillus decipiens]|nr:hypothetical protein BDR04DRAFT_1118813 [Suillus decipiens]